MYYLWNCYKPVLRKTVLIVFTNIIKSSRNDQLSIYAKSNSIHFSNLILFLSGFICQKHDKPGLTESLLNCQRLYCTVSLGSGGRGPIKDISPLRTLKSCGSSSRPVFLKNFPTFVTRGSSFILKTGDRKSVV
jgi:hypothetical protein